MGGGRYGARTHDLGIANAALSQTELTAHGRDIINYRLGFVTFEGAVYYFNPASLITL